MEGGARGLGVGREMKQVRPQEGAQKSVTQGIIMPGRCKVG